MRVFEIIYLIVSALSQLLMALSVMAIFGKMDGSNASDGMTEGVRQAAIAVSDEEDGDYYVSKRGSTIKVSKISRDDSQTLE